MDQPSADFAERYGPWGVVLGASEGLGAAYAHQLARRGLNVVVAARRAEPLAAVAAALRDEHGVDARSVAVDLASPDLVARLRGVTDGLDVGLLIHNGTADFIGPFVDEGYDHAQQQVAVNVLSVLAVCDHYGRPMVARGRGGVILMSSGAGVAGTAGLAVYSATKSFQLTLAQALHEEWSGDGVDVLGVVGPAIDTPNFRRSFDHDPDSLPHPPLPPDVVAGEVVEALGHTMELMPGEVNHAGYDMLSAMPRVDQARALSARFRSTSRDPRVSSG
jgi:short-subunit dehydrogenase